MRKRLNRRDFLRLGALGVLGAGTGAAATQTATKKRRDLALPIKQEMGPMGPGLPGVEVVA